MDMGTEEAIIKGMREKGLKITAQRRAIIEALVELGNLHPGASLVYRAAKKKRRSLSLSTTYATLDELSRHGLIKTLQFDRMENRCEMNREEHINLICGGCGKIVDYPSRIGVDENDVTKETGFTITDARLEYYGYCKECGKNRSSS